MNKRTPTLIRYIFLAIAVIMLGMVIGAQNNSDTNEEKASVKMIVRALPDSIILRWAPDDYRLWLSGNKHGYIVTRTCLIRNGEFTDNEPTVMLTSQPLKPIPYEKWESLADKNDLAAIAAEAIFGDEFEINLAQGGIVSIANKIAEQENRLGFALLAADLSMEVAIASGLMFVDREAKKGEKYLYRVFPAVVPVGITTDSAFFFTGVDEYLPLPSPINVKAEPSDKNMLIKWDATSQQGFFTAFWVERSDDDGKSFNKLNTSPIINPESPDKGQFSYHFYSDSIANNNKNYQYRVLGITPFGEVSPPSNIVIARGINTINSVPTITSLKSDNPDEVIIEWELNPEQGEIIDGLRILRAEKFDGQYDIIADNILLTSSLHIDKHPLKTAYYRMQAYNFDGNGPISLPSMMQLIDSIPPAAPLGLQATVDNNGVVNLTWQHNGETDLFGYRIFRANNIREEFSQITPASTVYNHFTDTISLNTLTSAIYYKIIAVDESQNRSEFSEILVVKRPDIVPPAPPRIRSALSMEDGIEILWVKSPSPDVEKQLLYRNSENNAQWNLIKNLDANTSQYTDTTTDLNILYRYLFVVVDSAGNESKPTKFVSVRF